MNTAESDRRGYRLEIGLDDQDIAAGPCDRPVQEDRDRCLWHAPVDGKTRRQLERGDPDLRDAVHGAYLREAWLANVDWFAGRSLVGADLTGADVKGADFSDADLTLATLTDVSAICADFSDANLEGAILTNADVRRATLAGARLHETVLTDMHIGAGRRWARWRSTTGTTRRRI